MKTYIFLFRRICGIGGAEQYIYNKTSYLERHGWRVLVFSGEQGQILIKDFKRFKKYIYAELFYNPSCFRKSVVNKTIQNLIYDIGNCHGDECVIESNYLPSCIWGEMLASRIKARHLAIPLQEKHSYDENTKKYLWFKYNRHELAGITKYSVRMMLNDESVELRDDTRISAYCNNVFDNNDDPYSQLLDDSAQITMGSLGRLSKPCVPIIVDGFCSYAKMHSDVRFNVVMIGDSEIKDRKKTIPLKLGSIPNIHVVMTGNIYPIPRSFGKRFDVFVSTAGAAGATYNEGYPTVNVNPLNGEPIGVIGLDYMKEEKTMYESSPDMTIEDCIDKAITQRNKIIFTDGHGEEYEKKMEAEFERQLSFLHFTDEKDYYDENLLMRMKQPHTRFPIRHRLLGHLLGGNGYERFRKIFCIKQ